MIRSRSQSCLFRRNSSCLTSPRDTARALVSPLLFSRAFCTFFNSGDVGGGGIGSGNVSGRGSASGDVGSSGRGGGGAAAAAAVAAEAKIPNGERSDHRSHFPVWKHLRRNPFKRRKKAEKVYFYLRHKNCNIANLAPIFSDARSGTIANKNQ